MVLMTTTIVSSTSVKPASAPRRAELVAGIRDLHGEGVCVDRGPARPGYVAGTTGEHIDATQVRVDGSDVPPDLIRAGLHAVGERAADDRCPGARAQLLDRF